MNKLITAACAVALAFAWSSAPAIAADDPAKTDDKTVKEKAVDVKDKVKDKAVEIKDKTKEKAVEIKDKTKEKLVEGKDKVKGAFKRDKTDKDMPGHASMTDVRAAQQALMDKGYKPGPIDGIHGPRTSAAVREFQTKEGLNVTGQLDADTMAKLNLSTAAAPAAPGSTAPAASPATEGAATKQTK